MALKCPLPNRSPYAPIALGYRRLVRRGNFLQIYQSSAKRDAQCVPQWDATPKGEAKLSGKYNPRMRGFSYNADRKLC
jgi:hypothetical protein